MSAHRINKTVLDFSVSAQEQDSILLKIKELFYNKALPKISGEFDKIGDDLYVDTLKIDLGDITIDQFEEFFYNAFKKELTENLSSVFRKEQNVAEKLPSGFTTDTIFFFLKNGFWPWNFQQKSERELSVLIHAFASNHAQMSVLFHTVKGEDANIAERLMGLMFAETKLRNVFIEALTKRHEILQLLWPLLSKNWERKITEKSSFTFIFTRELLVVDPVVTLSDTRSFFKQLVNVPAIASVIDKKEQQKLISTIEKKQDIKAFQPVFSAIRDTAEKKKSAKDVTTALALVEGKEAITDAQKEEGKQHSPGPKFFDDSEPEKINILNAGLILFHPYLRYAFKDLTWIGDDNQFINRKVQQKAILFLQYMVNGKSRQGEHLLVLNKILCGWPVHLPMQTACVFSAREKQAATDILESIKEHWKVIKNTSDKGVIESFVARPGIITKQGKGFLLQIERKTIDILLESLPFGLSTIKLPWNEYIIHTEW